MIRRAEVWAIATRKGGVLKTSLTVNLAGALARDGEKVLIVDMDSQGNVSVAFGKNPDKLKYTIYDVLTTKNATVSPAIINVYENIDVLPSNEKMEQFEFDVIPDRTRFPFPFTLLQDSIRGLRLDYDYILIDTPPTSVLVQSNALMFADKVLVPFQPESFSMRSLVKILNSIELFKKKHNRNLEIMGIVATLVDMRTSLHSEIMEQARKYCRKNKIPLFDTIIPRSVRSASDIAFNNLPTTLAQPNHKIAESYFELLEEVFDYVK